MRVRVVAAVSVMSIAFSLGGAAALELLTPTRASVGSPDRSPGVERPGAQGGTASQVPHRTSHRPVTSSAGHNSRAVMTATRESYWVAEFRRRWQEERADGQARAATIRRLRQQLAHKPSAQVAICQVFGHYCSQALRVAYCESRYYTGAQNGQYRGLFQMGSGERARYGHGWTALEQAVAAYRYFVASGKDWGPWECRP